MGGLGPSSTTATTPVSKATPVVEGGKGSGNGSGLGPIGVAGRVGSRAVADENIRNRAVSLGFAQGESHSRRRKGGAKSRSLKSRTSTSSLID